MEQDVISIFIYRAASNIISPLLVTLPFFLFWKYYKKRTVSDKAIFFLNFIIPLFILAIYVCMLFYSTSRHIILITFLISFFLILFSIPIAFIVAKINTWIIQQIFKIIDHKSRSPFKKIGTIGVALLVLVIIFPKSQEFVITWTKDSPPLPATVKKCFCAGFSSKSLKIASINQYCLGLTYQCVESEIYLDPLR